MQRRDSFDLEKAVATWRHVYAGRGAFLKEDLDELERHLRDHTESLIRRGLSEREAFDTALRGLGGIDEGVEEFGKVYWAKMRRRGRWRPELARRAAVVANYLKIGLRNAHREKGYTAIHVSGLAVGLACFFLMALYVQHELSYDDHFATSDRLYRVIMEETSEGRTLGRAVTPPALSPVLNRDFAAVEEAVRFGLTRTSLSTGDPRSSDMDVARADTNFFKVFPFEFITGDARSALTQPNSAVLTASTARRLFGTTDAVGRHLDTPGLRFAESLTVTGVVEDVRPTTHFTFDLIAPRSTILPPDMSQSADDQWWFYGDYTYVLLREDASASHLADRLSTVSERYLSDRPGISIQFRLQKVTDIHLHSRLDRELQPNGRAGHVYLFGAVGLVVLVLGCINFINLATARAVRRAREVGVRKAVGARRAQLVGQFLTESFVVVSMSAVLGFVLSVAALPTLERLAEIELAMRAGPLVWMLAGLPLLIAGVVLASGSYPAFVLSRFRPTVVLKGRTAVSSSSVSLMRRGLVVLQFACSIALLIGTAGVYHQISYMRSADLGLDDEHVVVLSMPTNYRGSFEPETIRHAFLQHEGVREVGFSRFAPAENIFANGSPIPEGSEREVPVYWHSSDRHYQDALGLEIVAGRGFTDVMAADTEGMSFLINETATRRFGWTNPLGKALLNPFNREPMGRVIGVVRDFHLTSLSEPIEPLVYALATDASPFRRILVRLHPGAAASAVPFLERQWHGLMSDIPFSYYFLDDGFDALYRAEERLHRIVSIFAVLAVFVASLGLIGLAAYTAQQRTKEIGIRRVLGATAADIVALLSREFAALVALSFLVAAPTAYYVLHRWLDGFAYRVDPGIGTFAAAGGTALLVALCIVGYRSLRAAHVNPVLSLRHE